MTKESVLQECTVEGNVVKLPNVQLERNIYLEVKKALELIGGKWKGGKVYGFVFTADPSDLLKQISNGETRNLKKEFQFFATPDEIADLLVNKAFALPHPLGKVLEPSAGQGAIIKAIHRFDPDINVHYCELMDVNQIILDKIENTQFEGADFLQHKNEYSVIIANPPFSKNKDIDHIRAMYECLGPGGRIVSIASLHWQTSGNKKEAEFREWLDVVAADIEEIQQGKFKESGTKVGGLIITINKK